MKIVFIKPNMISGTPGDRMEPLVFAVLSALTPAGIERRLYDERVEKIPYDVPADLVALTADTFSAKRAYQIARVFRRRGVPVVIGGFHPSLRPDEAGMHVDSVVIGDAEDTWPRIIADAEAGSLRDRYVSSYPPFGEVVPDRSLFSGKSYVPVRLIEFTRGCRFSCDFCSIRAMYKGKIRRKPLSSVLAEIDAGGRKHLVFTDDNLHADIPSLRRILHELANRSVRWSCQISADIIEHPDLVSLMGQAGCMSVTLGFESLERANLRQMRKTWMGDDHGRIIRAFNENGIMVYGTFILGYDHDTPATFDHVLAFALKHRLFLANFNPLIPTPETPLYDRLQTEGRLLLDPWWLHDDYRWGDSFMRPMGMSPEELTAGCIRIRQAFNSARGILSRFPGLPFRRTSLYKAGLFALANVVSRRELYRKYGRALGDAALVGGPAGEGSGAVGCT